MSNRPPPRYSAWDDTEPAEEREAREAAWQAYRSCRDCRYWIPGEDDDPDGNLGCCTVPPLDTAPVSFLVPEDYACEQWKAAE